MGNIVAIVGRPNVGKSTLYNRLVGERDAIMDDQSGVTRDNHYGRAEWQGNFFSVIDTGGYVKGSEDVFEEAIRDKVEVAIEEASVILFMVDVKTGVTGLDQDFANVLRKSEKPVIVVANKTDMHDKIYLAAEFHSLGFKEIFPVSSENGLGTGDLLEEIVKHFDTEGVEDPYAHLPKIAILGRPNAGKSSLLNFLTGSERSIVTDIPGTTRDAVFTHYNAYGKEFILTDTAGLRRKSRLKDNIEFYSNLRTIKAMEDADVCIVMIDAGRGFESQDMNIVALAQSHKKGVVILVNKWDLIKKETNTARDWEREIRDRLSGMSHIPIVFTSITEKVRIMKAIEIAIQVYEDRASKISTSKLNEKLLPEIERNPPPSYRDKHIKIKYITQLSSKTPAFALFCNFPNHIKDPYKRFIENKLRHHFGLNGVPVSLIFKKK
ncbi:ribosome biogenesis GTPase Der [Hyphobacterium sp. CCMP332]|nr:ribosome biogenesis GTPase Der [Hyphobacterium sp. CCMP332]